jgi:hypothetical protein
MLLSLLKVGAGIVKEETMEVSSGYFRDGGLVDVSMLPACVHDNTRRDSGNFFFDEGYLEYSE